ncbi:hypothetical protein NDA11_007106 [Ustilago hordei]|nr:hypothetical protein NDA11_007106 [Ustilago hordei]
MTRASTSAANFGLLLVALALMLHSVVGEHTPRHVRRHLSFPGKEYEWCFEKLTPAEKDYKKLCEGKSHPKHPCFVHWAGDLTTADVCPHDDPFHQMGRLVIKNNHMTDFTLDTPTDFFLIHYPKHGGVRLLYENYDPSTGCKDITLYEGKDPFWRIWVSDEYDDDKDIDTKKYEKASKRFCSKWIHIHVKKDELAQ